MTKGAAIQSSIRSTESSDRFFLISRAAGYRVLAVGSLLFILGTGFQAFLPPVLSMVMILLRLVVVPGIIVAFMLKPAEQISYAAVCVLFLFCEFALATVWDKETAYVFLSVLVSLPYFVAGLLLYCEVLALPLWRQLLVGLFAFNCITIGIYGNTLLGGSVASSAFARIGRINDDPLFRFALGNAIELPALVAIVTVAAAIGLRKGSMLSALALVGNLVAALISQSRFVVLISVVPIFRMWGSFRWYVRMALIILVTGFIFIQREQLFTIAESLSKRFSGDDANSARSRIEVFALMPKYIDLHTLTFGYGANSSMRMMESEGLGYRTVEAVAIQLFYECGVIRVTIMAMFLMYFVRVRGLHLKISTELILVLTQMFLALPVMTFTPLFAFCCGVLCLPRTRGCREEASSGIYRLRFGRKAC